MRAHQLKLRVTSEELQQRIQDLSAKIRADYENKNPILIGILKGAFVFLADLIRHFDFPLEIDFIRLASYGCETETCGTVNVVKDLEMSIENRHVLIVEDIVDSGITMNWLINHLQARNPKSLKICTLIDKHERRDTDVPVHYVGLRVEHGFLVGYGLDFSEQYRHLRGIYEVCFT